MRHGNALEGYDVWHFEKRKRLSGNSWQHETAGRDEWNLLKGKAGNTSPSACLPFGNVACSPYSGGKEKLEKQADLFFGFDESGCKDDRFEGFNNETDMETPYFYHYVGRYDKLVAIMKECTSARFRTGATGCLEITIVAVCLLAMYGISLGYSRLVVNRTYSWVTRRRKRRRCICRTGAP